LLCLGRFIAQLGYFWCPMVFRPTGRHTVNSSPVNWSHSCLITQSTRHKWAQHTTKPSAAGEGVPRNSCSTWTVCRQEEEVTENKW